MSTTQAASAVPTHWVGIDVSKASFNAAFIRDGQRWPHVKSAQIPQGAFERTAQGASEFAQWLDTLMLNEQHPPQVRALMEATGRYSVELTGWLVELRPGLAPAIVPPTQTAAFIKSMGLRNKTDKMDALGLGFYGMERQPRAYEAPSPQERDLRELVRYRNTMVEDLAAAKNRVQETGLCKAVAKMQNKRLEQLKRDIAKLEKEMRALLEKSPALKRDIELMCTIKGVGFTIATTVRAELGDLRRFTTARQLSAFAGLCPTQRQSGTSINGRSRMNKGGNSNSRSKLFMAGIVAIRHDKAVAEIQRNMVERGKPPMVALGAIMRKFLVLMRAILISGKPYDPMWKSRKMNNGEVTF